MTRLAQTPRVPVEGAVLQEPQLALDVALGVAGAVVGTGVALGRAVVGLPLLHQRMIWRPGFVAERWQPATLLDDAAGTARLDATRCYERRRRCSTTGRPSSSSGWSPAWT